MDAITRRQHYACVRVLPHITKLDDALGDFIVRVTCPCGASRHIEPEALAQIAGRSVTLAAHGGADAVLTVRQEGRRGGRGCETETAGCAEGAALTKGSAFDRGCVKTRAPHF